MNIYKGHIIYTKQKDEFEIIENGYIVVQDGLVQGVYSTLPHDLEGAAVCDFGNKLIIPAMNDVHVHAPQFRNQGIAMDLELLPWLENYTFPEESRFADSEYAKAVYSRFVHELWRYGSMRSVCFATVHEDATRILMNLFQKAGMGALVGKVAMNRNCPDSLTETVEESIGIYERLISEFGDDKSLVRPIITPRFVPSCTADMLRACGELARRHGLPVQSHLSENRSEIAWVKDIEPESTCYGDAYLRYGLFGQTPTVMAHCVWTDGEELELMKQHDVMVAHCPTSNLNLSSGMAPVRTFLDEGVKVGLGSDISGGHDLSIFRMMVYAIQVSKMQYCFNKKSFLTLPEVFWIATKSAGQIFGKVGSFEEGYEFDALVIDDSDLNQFDYSLAHRLERFIYLGDDRQIVRRFCRGREIAEPVIG